MSQVRMAHPTTVVSKGTKRGRNGEQVKIAEVIFEGRTYHVHFDSRADGWVASNKHPVNPGMIFNFAP